MLDMIVPAVAFVAIAMVMFGFPAIAIVIIRYLRLKERELTVEMEYRQNSDQRQLAIEERLQRIEDALSSDPDMRVRLEIGESARPLAGPADFAAGRPSVSGPRST